MVWNLLEFKVASFIGFPNHQGLPQDHRQNWTQHIECWWYWWSITGIKKNVQSLLHPKKTFRWSLQPAKLLWLVRLKTQMLIFLCLFFISSLVWFWWSIWPALTNMCSTLSEPCSVVSGAILVVPQQFWWMPIKFWWNPFTAGIDWISRVQQNVPNFLILSLPLLLRLPGFCPHNSGAIKNIKISQFLLNENNERQDK